MLKVYTMA